ncbi:hypothetical protein LTR37_014946 [Vermiconidia calcicola]|uniref:Uncharacterized protein n=1 Tax=Vermiconidia calcicola TaxID=1690605 RepID=A0ACC3MUZ4_9PEZI|nr:hypothetical protein LTR37_014946 [Vermiconidia calcicola]
MKSQGDNITGTSPIDFSKPLDTSVVKGKTALVQDGAAGLGSGIAKALAENGARVAICDKRAKEGEAFAKDLNGKGYDVKYIQAETGDWASSLAGFKQALEWSEDQLDIVVLSPGIVTNNLLLSILPKHRGPDEDPAEPPTNVLQIDLVGVYYATSLALFYFNKLYAKRKDPEFEPQIVFICSMAGYDGLDFGTDYAAAKHGLRAIFKTTRRPRPGMAQYQANLLAPTYVKKNKISKDEEKLKNHANEVNEISDVVAGAMRCICDDEVSGRAVACVQGSTGTPGRLNFDMCDDIVDHNGGRELHNKVDDIWLPSGTKLSEDSNCGVQ